MYRFKLNEQLEKYIREVRIEHERVDVIRDYLRELEYDVSVNINIGGNLMFFKCVGLVPDWQAQAFRISMSSASETTYSMNTICDFRKDFVIPFQLFLDGHVSVKTVDYGGMILTEKIIDMINDAYGDELYGYRYEFIKESFDKPFEYIYMINNKFYEAYVCSPNKYCFEYQLDLTECQTGQSHYVTALELLRGKYSYISELSKTEDGLLIPNLSIKKYKLMPPLEYAKKE
jgi:hypothetical protein